MNKSNISFEELQADIMKAYEEGTTLEQAERLAAKFLGAQMQVADRLKVVDLDCRMRKSGLKAVKAAIYIQEATKGDKKPTEAMLSATVDRNELVTGEQEAFDIAEVEREMLQNYFSIFREAHVYFRGVSKGRFE